MKFRELNIRHKIMLLGFILTTIVAGMFFYLSGSLNIVTKLENRYLLSIQAKDLISESQQYENKFLARSQKEYATKIRENLEKAKKISNQLYMDTKDLDEYTQLFLALTENKIEVKEYEYRIVPVAKSVLSKIEIFASREKAKQSQAISFSFIVSLLLVALIVAVFVWINKLAKTLFEREDVLHRNSMNMAMSISEYFNLMSNLSAGDLNVKASESTGDELFDQLGKATNNFVAGLRSLGKAAEEIAKGNFEVVIPLRSEKDSLGICFQHMLDELRLNTNELHATNMNLAVNLSEYFTVISTLAQGNFDVKANELTGNDLFNQLGKYTNQMIVSLRTLITKIIEQASMVNTSSGVLAQFSEEFTHSTAQLASTITQISTSNAQISQSTQSASLSANQANALAKKGRDVMANWFEKMQSIQNVIELSTTNMNDLAKRSNEIKEIVNVISKIANQTNLLSLNAAIEATHAGKEGGGFAIVADEVRKLAGSATKQAERIAKIIQQLTYNTEKTIGIIAQGRNDVQEGGALVDQTQKMFFEIVNSVENVAKQIEQIAASIEQTAASAEEASASSQQHAAAIEELASSSNQLSGTSSCLKEAIEQFKI